MSALGDLRPATQDAVHRTPGRLAGRAPPPHSHAASRFRRAQQGLRADCGTLLRCHASLGAPYNGRRRLRAIRRASCQAAPERPASPCIQPPASRSRSRAVTQLWSAPAGLQEAQATGYGLARAFRPSTFPDVLRSPLDKRDLRRGQSLRCSFTPTPGLVRARLTRCNRCSAAVN